MFTGIIEELGTIKSINKGNETIVLTIAAEKVLQDVHLGDSIAVNGVCLTVTSFRSNQFTVDVMPETFRSSTLKLLNNRDLVNLERAMAAGGRFGGHFVSGHVDGTGEIVEKRPEKNAIYYTISLPDHLMKYFMLKGSVCVDGTSLTVFDVTNHTITVSLIPHTADHTILGKKTTGDLVNIECDMLAKYVARMLSPEKEETKQKSKMSLEFLQEHGF
ncbi:riboflavin synthase [Fictibacillus phosphorivorans]|uniref:riboflavin synthase n=1 Tax=Fictibacillus phosphorivorans TaxID=1221500 RepID=UPI00203F216E|nr:riboflavin synthase [Fictibacillus phosphorivorans]MCM3717536.1 riboflavin synthase [Fictibacillus phosphorivorans]MCM3775231.1 riboflavin synthase [Fictibacillus phosphorivorans]